jgi:hypothetical protein
MMSTMLQLKSDHDQCGDFTALLVIRCSHLEHTHMIHKSWKICISGNKFKLTNGVILFISIES